MKRSKSEFAFSLVEILIVVCVLGILAAIITPHYSNATTLAKEATAKDILQSLRTQIDRYTLEHKDVPPGFANGDVNSIPVGAYMVVQFNYFTNINSQWSTQKTNEFCYGPYIKKFPKNPLNGKGDVYTLTTEPPAGDWPPANGTYGWIYHPKSKRIRINTFGNDSEGINFQSY